MSKPIKNDPNSYIRHNMFKHNITQKELCKLLSISHTTLLKYIELDFESITLDKLIIMASLFGVPVHELVYYLLRDKPKGTDVDKWYLSKLVK